MPAFQESNIADIDQAEYDDDLDLEVVDMDTRRRLGGKRKKRRRRKRRQRRRKRRRQRRRRRRGRGNRRRRRRRGQRGRVPHNKQMMPMEPGMPAMGTKPMMPHKPMEGKPMEGTVRCQALIPECGYCGGQYVNHPLCQKKEMNPMRPPRSEPEPIPAELQKMPPREPRPPRPSPPKMSELQPTPIPIKSNKNGQETQPEQLAEDGQYAYYQDYGGQPVEAAMADYDQYDDDDDWEQPVEAAMAERGDYDQYDDDQYFDDQYFDAADIALSKYDNDMLPAERVPVIGQSELNISQITEIAVLIALIAMVIGFIACLCRLAASKKGSGYLRKVEHFDGDLSDDQFESLRPNI